MTIIQRKNTLRQAMKARRGALNQDEIEAAARGISYQLAKLDPDFSCVAVYLAKGDEARMDAFIEALLKWRAFVVAPVYSAGAEPHFAQIDSMESLRIGAFGLRMPPASPVVAPQTINAVFLPGLAFDTSGARLGYGGGWYDRLRLNLRPNCALYGVCYDFQVLDEVPCEAHDARVNYLVTPSQTHDCF